jgi:hypothetical protein
MVPFIIIHALMTKWMVNNINSCHGAIVRLPPRTVSTIIYMLLIFWAGVKWRWWWLCLSFERNIKRQLPNYTSHPATWCSLPTCPQGVKCDEGKLVLNKKILKAAIWFWNYAGSVVQNHKISANLKNDDAPKCKNEFVFIWTLVKHKNIIFHHYSKKWRILNSLITLQFFFFQIPIAFWIGTRHSFKFQQDVY